MPPWNSIQPSEHTCIICGSTFLAKRASAKYCTTACQNRARVRVQYPAEKRAAWRRKRLEQPGYRERINAQTNDRATSIRRWLDAYKVRVGCADCGYNAHAAALDFDHIGHDKTINVCNAKSIAQAQNEIAKCEVRCSNCHRVRTWERLQDHKSP